jgi:multicomponent Na+:H+ antiporter subunit E
LLLSGHFDTKMLAFGAGSVVFVVVLAHRMGLVDAEGHPVQLSWKFPIYFIWLAWKVLLANLIVVREILRRKITVAPQLIQISCGQADELHQVIYANSITLTPGTVTMRLQDGEVIVHALTGELAADLQTGTMEQRVRKLTGEG